MSYTRYVCPLCRKPLQGRVYVVGIHHMHQTCYADSPRGIQGYKPDREYDFNPESLTLPGVSNMRGSL